MYEFYAKLSDTVMDIALWLEQRAIGKDAVNAYKEALVNPYEDKLLEASFVLKIALARLRTNTSARHTLMKCIKQIDDLIDG